MLMSDVFTREELLLKDYLEKNNLMVCTHFHDTELGFGKDGYYYLEDKDFYDRNSTIYASREVPFYDVKGLHVKDGMLCFPDVQIPIQEC